MKSIRFFKFIALVILFRLALLSVSGQNISYRFENFSLSEGLSQTHVKGLTQDRKGFLWIATEDGLNRYDGYSFKVYRHELGDSSSLADNLIQCLYYDSLTLWIGTNRGVCRYDAEMDRFSNNFAMNTFSSGIVGAIVSDRRKNIWIGAVAPSHIKAGVYFMNPQGGGIGKIDDERLDANVWTAFRDSKGVLWFGTDGKGIVSIDPATRTILKVVDIPLLTKGQSRVTCIFEDSNGNYWFGTNNGLIRYNPARNDSIKVFSEHGQENLLDNRIGSIYEDRHNKSIWIGSYLGISILYAGQDHFTNIQHDPSDKMSLPENRIMQFFEDRSGNLWIGQHYAGLTKLSYNKGFKVLNASGSRPDRLLTNVINSVYEDKPGSLWVSCIGKGINHLVKTNEGYHVVEMIESNDKPSWLSTPDITAVTQTKDGVFWFGTWGSGLYRYEPVRKTFEHVVLPQNNEVFSIFSGPEDKLLIGTNRTGLYQYDPTKKYFLKLIPDPGQPSTLMSTAFSNILQDSTGRIFATSYTRGVIFQYNKMKNRFYAVKIIQQVPGYEPGTNIHSAYIDGRNHFWIGTKDGLAKYDIHRIGDSVSLTLKYVYHKKDGLPNEVINRIFGDHQGNLWMGHVHGLSKLNTLTNEFTNFDVTDGLPGNEFTYAGSRISGNELAFGTNEGLVIFHPDSLRPNPHIPNVEFTDLKISNKSVVVHNTPEDKHQANRAFGLSAAIGYTTEIVLPYDTKIFSIEFSALELTAPGRNQYRYKLEGFDNEWINSGGLRTATFTNLNSGSYTLRVNASNNDGLWNEEGRSMRIIILPPPWRTWWAYSIYVLTGVALLFAARLQIIRRERLKNEVRLKKIEADKYLELDGMKSRFFANISHEFRTPLTLILGPLEKYLSAPGNSPGKQAELRTMHKNATRLLNLVNQLLELSRIEAGSIKLTLVSGELVAFVRALMSEFQSIADSKQIHFSLDCHEDSLPLYFDHDKLSKILNNLLSNGFKFTPDGGDIRILIQTERMESPNEQMVNITVEDNGIGIPEQHLNKIFDRFYQVDGSLTRGYDGSGIGLALTKELVEICGGHIFVESKEQIGSSFVVRLPLRSSDKLGSDTDTLVTETESHPNNNSSIACDETLEMASLPQDHSPTLLVIEDNADLRNYLKKELSTLYHVIESPRGDAGIEMAIREIPEVIISDLMMPGKNGFEVCDELKRDERTSHIPVILLTAKAELESKLHGYQTGADDYIAKPFLMPELIARIANLLANRKRLKMKYAQALQLRPSEIKTVTAEDRFLKKILEVVESHMANPDFGLEMFAESAGMSKIQLYRKLKALTPYTPNEFIRHIRLQRAKELLEHRAGTVSEIAYQVGVRNLPYFSRIFKQEFGKNPSEIVESSV